IHRLPLCPTLFPYTTLFRSENPLGTTTNVPSTHSNREYDMTPPCGAGPARTPGGNGSGPVQSGCGTTLPPDHFTRINLRRSSVEDRKSTRLNSSHVKISYAV